VPGLLSAPTFDCRQAFADELAELARSDDRIVAVCNDSVGSSNLVAFRKEFPNRLINVGIAEQDMVGIAAGLANAGFVPFVSAAAPFLTGRAMEQIKADVAYSGHRVILCGQSPGMAYGPLGPTHHSVEDLSWMRAIAGLPVVVPTDPDQTRSALRWAARHSTGSYIRIPRVKVPALPPTGRGLTFREAITLREGTDATIVAVGTPVSASLEAADILADEGVSVRVLNTPFVAPLDIAAIVRAAEETGVIVTVEEATLSGGLGAAVAAAVVQNHPVPVRMLGVCGFAPTGDPGYLLSHFGLDTPSIAAAVREAVVRRDG
jgi:transketolase